MRSFAALVALAAALAIPGAATAASPLRQMKHIVVIYEENHSFDNLYGGWEGVNGLRGRRRGAHAPGQPGRHAVPVPAAERRQPHLAAAGRRPAPTPRRHRVREPLPERAVPRSTTTSRRRRRRARRPASSRPTACSNGSGLPGGCTRDLVHRYYQEQYQLDGGRQDRYVTGSDAVGLTMGYYDTRQLPIYRYLHGRGTRATRSPTTSSRRRSAARSSTTSGSSPRARRSGPTRSTTAAPTTCTPWSTPTACRPSYPLYAAAGAGWRTGR